MLYNCYLKNGIVYVPTIAKVAAGGYMDVDPVVIVPVSNTEKVRLAFQETIARGNPTVPTPTRANHPEPVILKYAGVKSWAAFARGTFTWSIQEKDGDYQIVGYKNGAGRGWSEDPEQTVRLPSGAAIDDVIGRLIAILQTANSRS